MPYLCLAVLAALLAVREWQHAKTVAGLIDRLMIKSGFEPLAEPEEEEPVVVKKTRTSQDLLAAAGAVKFRIPTVDEYMQAQAKK